MLASVAMLGCRFDASGNGTASSSDASASDALTSSLDWWDESFGSRLPLVIDETASGTLPAGYSVVVELDTSSIVAAGDMQTNGDDLRIVWFDGTSYVELDRRVIGMNTTATNVWFKTQADIDASDESYALYYGNATASSPPERWSDSMGADPPSAVYLAADDFQEHAPGTCPDGWGSCGTNWAVQESGDRRGLVSEGNGEYLLAGDASWTDVLVEASVRSNDPNGCPGIASRVEDSNNLVYAGYYCDTPPMPPDNVAIWPRINGSYNPLVYTGVTIGTEAHIVATAWTGDVVRLYHDGQLVGMDSAPSEVATAGRVGLFSTYGTTLLADDVVVRLFVDPEPTVTTGSVQTAP